jgi:hypothetical protein
MNRMFSILGGAAVAAGLAVSAVAHEGHNKEAGSKPVALQGELIDTACYVASDGDAKGKDHADCARECLGSGIPAGILPEGSKAATDLMFLLTNPKPLAQYAGQTIKVEGEQHTNMHAIDAKKVFVQDGSGGWKEIKLDDAHHKMGGDAEGEKKAADGEQKKDDHSSHKH